MNKEQFIDYITYPEKLNTVSLKELEEIVETFPYFQTARLLLTINLYKENNIKYHSVLKTTAVYAGNRNILKKHIDRAGKERVTIIFDKEKQTENNATPPNDIPAQEKTEQQKETAPTSETTDEPTTPTPSTETKSGSSEEDTIAQLKKIIEQRIREIEAEKKGRQEKPSQKQSKKSKFDLIDEFIAKEPTISRPKAKFYDPVESAKESVVEKEDIVSETLAKIYYDQGYFEKAVRMYEKLILKYPEKSSYFAALIEKANNELNKNQ